MNKRLVLSLLFVSMVWSYILGFRNVKIIISNRFLHYLFFLVFELPLISLCMVLWGIGLMEGVISWLFGAVIEKYGLINELISLLK